MQPKINKLIIFFKKESIGNRADHTEERISELKDRILEIIWAEERELRSKKLKKFYENYPTPLERAT